MDINNNWLLNMQERLRTKNIKNLNRDEMDWTILRLGVSWLNSSASRRQQRVVTLLMST